MQEISLRVLPLATYLYMAVSRVLLFHNLSENAIKIVLGGDSLALVSF